MRTYELNVPMLDGTTSLVTVDAGSIREALDLAKATPRADTRKVVSVSCIIDREPQIALVRI